MLSHEDPKTLHAPLFVGFHLNGQYLPVPDSQIVYFRIAPLGRVLPVVHLRLLETVAVFLHFQSGKHLRCASIVHQIHIGCRQDIKYTPKPKVGAKTVLFLLKVGANYLQLNVNTHFVQRNGRFVHFR